MIYTIAIAALSVCSALLALMYFQNRNAAKKYECKSESLAETVADLRAELTGMKAQDGKSVSLLTPESLLDFLTNERGFQAEYDEESSWMTFTNGDHKFSIQCSRLPQQVILRNGYGRMEDADVDWNVMRECAHKVADELVMVKMNVEDNDFYDYYIVGTDRTLETFRINFEFYMSILHDAEVKFHDLYMKTIDQSNGQGQKRYVDFAEKMTVGKESVKLKS